MGAGKKITQTMELELILKGLKELEKALKLVTDPSKLTEQGRKEYEKLLKTITGVFDQAKVAQENNLGPETIKLIVKAYEATFQQFGKTISKLFVGIGQDFQAEFAVIEENINQFAANVLKIEKQLKLSRTRFNVDTEKDFIEAKTKTGVQEAQSLGLDALNNKNKLGKEAFKTEEEKLKLIKQTTREREKIRELLTGSKDISKEELETFLQTGQASEKFKATADAILRDKKSGIQIDESARRIQTLHTAEQIGLGEKLKQVRALETQQIAEQKALDEERVKQNQLLVTLQKETAGTGKKEDLKINKEISEVFRTFSAILEEYNKMKRESIQLEGQDVKAKEQVTRAVRTQESTFGKAAKQVFNYGIAFSFLRRIYRETLRTIRDLDKALTEMAIVTSMNRKEAWQLAGTMSQLARETGFTTTEISKLATVFIRQGRSLREVNELTKVAAQAARIAGISGAESANFLTSAVNGFGLAANQVLAVSDKFAALAASSASSYEELAVGLSKFAAQANVAGISMDFAMGLLAKGVETTREAPETIGTALKTVLARMRELTDFGKTLEDGMDISRVETALRQVGVSLRNARGEFRDMDAVLTDIGNRWSTLNREQQASVAVALAGTRQQSRLIAIMQDFDRTLELVNIAQESAGATTAQHVEFMKGLEAATAGLQNAWQNFITELSNSEVLIDVVRQLTTFVDFLTNSISKLNEDGNKTATWLIKTVIVMKSLQILMKTSNLIARQSIILSNLGLVTKIKDTIATIKQDLALKKLNITTKTYTKAQKKKIATEIAAIKTKTLLWAATKKLTVTMMTNPVTLAFVALAAAITAIVVAFNRFKKASEDVDETLQKTTQEIQAQNYEINRSIRNMSKLNRELEEFGKLPFFTQDQRKDLEDLGDRLEEIVGEEYVVRTTLGEIDIKATRDLLEEWRELQEEQKRILRRDLLESTSQSIEFTPDIIVDRRWVTTGEYDGFWEAFEREVEGSTNIAQLSARQIANFGDIFIQEFEDVFGNLSNEAQMMYRRALENALKTDPNFVRGLVTGETSLSDFVSRSVAPMMSTFQAVSSQLNEEGLTLESAVERYRTIMSSVALPQDVKNAIKETFEFLDFVSEQDLDLQLLDRLGITTPQAIQEAYAGLGETFSATLQNIEDIAAEIAYTEGITQSSALAIAYAQAGRAAEDAATKAYLYGQAFSQTNLEISQQLDRISSRIDNISKSQQQWLEGSLSAQDLFEFFERNMDLFEDMDDVLRFLSGESINEAVYVQKIEQEREATSRLAIAIAILNDETATTEQRNQALKDFAFFSALTQYTGDLKNLTIEQQRYNATLAQYNRFVEMGIDTTEIQNDLIAQQAVVVNQSANRTIQSLAGIEQRFKANAEAMGLSSNQFNDFFQVVNGTVVPAFDMIEGLGKTALEFIESIMSEYQGTLNEAFDEFKALRDQDLKLQKEHFDEQKKIYQDYFAALDRLEQQRSRARSREDLVAQLQRLEGATDERSRKRAMEIRRELNKLDQDAAKDSQTAARESLLQGFDERYAQLEENWAQASMQFIENLSEGGTASGGAFVDAVNQANLFEDVEIIDIDSLGTTLETFSGAMEAIFGEGGSFSSIDWENILAGATSTTGTSEPQFTDQETAERERVKQQFIDAFVANQVANAGGLLGGTPDDYMAAIAAITRQGEAEFKKLFGYRKGGMVDHTGLAVLHGTKSAPEAVLSASQTEMFVGLRNALEKVSINGSNTGSINIENISISTGSMNNNQDFKRAGESLAEAFKTAIQRKGVTFNTNRT